MTMTTDNDGEQTCELISIFFFHFVFRYGNDVVDIGKCSRRIRKMIPFGFRERQKCKTVIKKVLMRRIAGKYLLIFYDLHLILITRATSMAMGAANSAE